MLDSKLQVYLIGAIEKADDLGVGWRKELTPFLLELGLKVLDPTKFEPQQLKGLQPNRLPEFFTDENGKQCTPTHWHHLKSATEPHLQERFKRYMQRIIRFDLKIVEDSDFMVVRWDKVARQGAGSYHEIGKAFELGKPVYCVQETELPAWLKACCTETFKTFTELKDFLKEEFDYEK